MLVVVGPVVVVVVMVLVEVVIIVVLLVVEVVMQRAGRSEGCHVLFLTREIIMTSALFMWR